MEKKIKEISDAYSGFYTSILKKGKLPMKDTGIGFWNAADTPTLVGVLSRIGKHNSFMDLGSGDGKVVMLASLFARKAVGVEFDRELHEKALVFAEKLGVRNVEFINADFNGHSVKGYDVVFINPDKPMFRGVEQKLVNELTGRLVVFGHHFHPEKLEKVDSFLVDGTLVGVYKNPSKNT